MDHSRPVARLALVVMFASLAAMATANKGWSQTDEINAAQHGFLFLDGQYLPPPYQIHCTADALTINGYEFTSESFDLSDYSDQDQRSRGSRRRQHFGRFGRLKVNDSRIAHVGLNGDSRDVGSDVPGLNVTPLESLGEDLRSLRFGSILVLYPGVRPLPLGFTDGGVELLRSLNDPKQADDLLPESVRDEHSRATWSRLVSEFQLNDPFEQHVRRVLNRVDAAESEGERVIAGTYWIKTISYPLTVFAMGFVVLGFGHLLTNRPKLEEPQLEHPDWTKHRTVVGHSLLIVAMLSLVDLIWTLGAANAGLIRELNPLGSGLIDQPFRLFLFKAAITGISIGILYRLYRRPIAQVASWWCCLLLTLLTARWVMFQSMFL